MTVGTDIIDDAFPTAVRPSSSVGVIDSNNGSVLIGDLMEGELQPEYWELFGLPIVAVMLFATLVAPEAIVRDRRDGMLRLYLSTPLTAPTYLTAKFVAVMTSMAIVVAGPALLYLVANTIQGLGPDGFANWLEVAAKLLLSSGIIVVFFAAVSLGAASVTDRRAFASVAVLAALFGVSIVVNISRTSVEQLSESIEYLSSRTSIRHYRQIDRTPIVVNIDRTSI